MGGRIVVTLAAVLLVCLAGCTNVIRDEMGKGADSSVTIELLKESPSRYLGKLVMLGGMVAETRNTPDGGQLEIVQFPLADDGYPEKSQVTGGRFLATAPTLLEPLVYLPGTLVTLTGEFKGTRTRPLDEVSYTYPVVSIREIHLWQEDDEPQRPFGIPGTNLIDPYYYGHDVPMQFRPEGTIIRPNQ